MKRVKYSNFLIIGVFIYIIFQIMLLFIGKSISTIVLERESIEAKITTKGLLIRDESLVKSDISGTLVLNVKNGEKVKAGQTIGKIYNDEEGIDENKKQIELLNNEIKKIKYESNSKLNSITLTQIKTKNDQIKLLENQNKKNTYYVDSPISGIVCYKYDGNEELYNTDMLKSLTKDDIENVNNSYKNINKKNHNIKEGQIIARIVNSNESYIAICVEDKDLKIFEENQGIKIKFNNDILDGVVNNIDKHKDCNIVTLKITNQNVEIYDTRVKEFDIIYKQVEGLKIPKSCVKEIENKQGVYVLNQQTKKSEFVELKSIQYENKDFIFIDDYKNDIQGIKTVRVNDEVILRPNSINTNIRIK